MPEPLTYSLEHANGTADLTLTPERFIVRTQGRGLLDKPRTVDIALSDLDKFCVVSTIAAQNVVDATGATMVYDQSYDAEFIFSYREGGKVNKKRLFVDGGDADFRALLEGLRAARPDASLLNLDPAEAQRQIGVVSAKTALPVIIGAIVALPLIVGLIVMLTKHH